MVASYGNHTEALWVVKTRKNIVNDWATRHTVSVTVMVGLGLGLELGPILTHSNDSKPIIHQLPL